MAFHRLAGTAAAASRRHSDPKPPGLHLEPSSGPFRTFHSVAGSRDTNSLLDPFQPSFVSWWGRWDSHPFGCWTPEHLDSLLLALQVH